LSNIQILTDVVFLPHVSQVLDPLLLQESHDFDPAITLGLTHLRYEIKYNKHCSPNIQFGQLRGWCY